MQVHPIFIAVIAFISIAWCGQSHAIDANELLETNYVECSIGDSTSISPFINEQSSINYANFHWSLSKAPTNGLVYRISGDEYRFVGNDHVTACFDTVIMHAFDTTMLNGSPHVTRYVDVTVISLFPNNAPRFLDDTLRLCNQSNFTLGSLLKQPQIPSNIFLKAGNIWTPVSPDSLFSFFHDPLKIILGAEPNGGMCIKPIDTVVIEPIDTVVIEPIHKNTDQIPDSVWVCQNSYFHQTLSLKQGYSIIPSTLPQGLALANDFTLNFEGSYFPQDTLIWVSLVSAGDTCSYLESIQIIAKEPPPSLATSEITLCPFDTTTVWIGSSQGHELYIWENGDWTLQPTFSVTNSGNNSSIHLDSLLVKIVDPQTGCEVLDSLIVRNLPLSLPSGAQIMGDSQVCIQQGVHTYRIDYNKDVFAEWDVEGGDIIASNNQEVKVSFTAENAAITAYLSSEFGCLFDTLSMPIAVSMPQQLQILMQDTVQCIHSGTVPVSVYPQRGGYTYFWEIEKGSVIGSHNQATAQIRWDAPGEGIISVTAVPEEINNCQEYSGTARVTLLSNDLGEIIGPDKVCLDENTVEYRFPQPSVQHIVWSVDGGMIMSGQHSNAVQVKWTEEGMGQISASIAGARPCPLISHKEVEIGRPASLGFAFFKPILCDHEIGSPIPYQVHGVDENQYVQWQCVGGQVIQEQNEEVLILWDRNEPDRSLKAKILDGNNVCSPSETQISIEPEPSYLSLDAINKEAIGNEVKWTITVGGDTYINDLSLRVLDSFGHAKILPLTRTTSSKQIFHTLASNSNPDKFTSFNLVATNPCANTSIFSGNYQPTSPLLRFSRSMDQIMLSWINFTGWQDGTTFYRVLMNLGNGYVLAGSSQARELEINWPEGISTICFKVEAFQPGNPERSLETKETCANRNAPPDLPNVITPNGDGINDVWFLPLVEDFPQNKLVLMDRYGNLKKEFINYSNNWSPEHLSAGTYFYRFESNGTYPRTGWLFIGK